MTRDAAQIPGTGRLVAVDWGERRIGLAVSDPSQTIAQPLATLTRRPGKRFPMLRLREHLDTLAAVGVVVGLPLDAAGAEGPAARSARRVGTLVAEKTGLPVVFADERMTTARALTTVKELGGTTRHRREDLDQMAATILLQHYLDRRRT